MFKSIIEEIFLGGFLVWVGILAFSPLVMFLVCVG